MSTFVLKNIQMTLDPESINKAIEEVEKLKQNLEPALKHLCEYLADWGVEVAKANIIQFGLVGWTQELYQSIQPKEQDGAWFVYSDAKYAAYVEFGTGTVGGADPHPIFKEQDRQRSQQAQFGRVMNIKIRRYDLKNHGDKGWVFKGSDGKWHTTHGSPPKPYMYNTYRELLREAELNGGRIVAQYIP